MDRRTLVITVVLVAAVITAGCTQTASTRPYACPEKGRIDCMPGPGSQHPACGGNYSSWVQTNCNVTFTY
jgi:hypothetical protein